MGALCFLGRDQPTGQVLDLCVATSHGILAGAQRCLGLFALDDLGFECTPLALEALYAPALARDTTMSPATVA